VQEIDWSTGQISQFLKDANLDSSTLLIFSSDNGPWFQGSAGQLRGRKGETWDGGMRMPMIARFSGYIPGGTVSHAVTTTMDVFPTVAGLTGAALPPHRLDGVDISSILTGEKRRGAREVFLDMNGWDIQAARWGRWKLHVSRNTSPPWAPVPNAGIKNLPLPHPELYDLHRDPSESYDISADEPDVVATIRDRMQALIATLPQNVQD